MNVLVTSYFFRIEVLTWRSVLFPKGSRCGGKAADDPIHKHLELDENKILRSVCMCYLVEMDRLVIENDRVVPIDW
jgi:hypothetical protein